MADDEALYGLLGEQLKSTSQTVPNLSGYVYIYIYTHIYISIYIYESQPKACAEYRYKRSEANLGGVGGGGSDSGPFGKVRPEPGWGELQK